MSSKTTTELKEAIANLEQILDSGASSVSVDGETTTFDLKAIASRIKDLNAELATLQGKQNKRPIFNRLDLS